MKKVFRFFMLAVLILALWIGAGIAIAPHLKNKDSVEAFNVDLNRLIWDIDSEKDLGYKEKNLLKLASNLILLRDKNCHILQSGNKSQIKPGTYYVHCVREDGQGYNINFTTSDVYNDTIVTEIKGHPEAFELCLTAIKSDLSHPSTFRGNVFDQSTDALPNGYTTVNIGFKARNAYGLEIKHRAICDVAPNGKTKMSVFEE